MAVNSLFYILVMTLFGLPMWFLTTSTYRAPLPFEKIGEISSMKNLHVNINFELVFFNKNAGIKVKDIESRLLKELYLSKCKFSFLMIKINY